MTTKNKIIVLALLAGLGVLLYETFLYLTDTEEVSASPKVKDCDCEDKQKETPKTQVEVE